MAVQPPFSVSFDEVFPQGAFVLGVEPVEDFERKQSGAQDPQVRDKSTGERMWVVRVLDPDPTARSAELKVKIAAPVQPIPPDATAGGPFRPVEFDNLTVMPYVKEGNRPRVAYSLRATRMHAPTTRRPEGQSGATPPSASSGKPAQS